MDGCPDLPSAGVNRFRFNGSAYAISAKGWLPEVELDLGGQYGIGKAKGARFEERHSAMCVSVNGWNDEGFLMRAIVRVIGWG